MSAENDPLYSNFRADGTDQSLNMQSYKSVEKLEAISTPTAGGHTMKDQETLIQELKKENFDLKLRLYMEQKERERVTEEFKAKIVVLEADLTEALDELGDALEREKEYEVSLNESKKRERALMSKQRRLEETAREQENEISYLTLTRHSNQKVGAGGNKVVSSEEAASQTDFPYYQERSVDVNLADVNLKDGGAERSAHFSNEATAGGPEGVDLLNNGTLIKKKNDILREAKRRRTAKKNRDRDGKGYRPPGDAPRAGKRSLFSRICCCCASKDKQSAEYDVENGTKHM